MNSSTPSDVGRYESDVSKPGYELRAREATTASSKKRGQPPASKGILNVGRCCAIAGSYVAFYWDECMVNMPFIF